MQRGEDRKTENGIQPMTRKILIEAFGALTTNDTYSGDLDRETIAEATLQEIDSLIDLSSIDTIVTGMNPEFTYALQHAINALDLDINVNAFYPDVNSIKEQDNISYQEAWQRGYTWRNNKLFVANDSNDQQTVVDAAIRVGDADSSGVAMLEQARRKNVPAIDINLNGLIDRDLTALASDGDNETLDEYTESEPSASESVDTTEEEPVSAIHGIGSAYSDRLNSHGIETVSDLSNSDPETIGSGIDGVSPTMVAEWVEGARIKANA